MQSASVSILFAISHGLTKHTMSYYVDEWHISFLLLTLNVRGPSYLGQYHGSLRCQDISSHDIDYVE